MFIFLTFVNSTEEGHICRPPLRSERLVVFFKGFFIALERSILEELAAHEKCGGDPSPCMGPTARDMDGHAGG